MKAEYGIQKMQKRDMRKNDDHIFWHQTFYTQ